MVLQFQRSVLLSIVTQRTCPILSQRCPDTATSLGEQELDEIADLGTHIVWQLLYQFLERFCYRAHNILPPRLKCQLTQVVYHQIENHAQCAQWV